VVRSGFGRTAVTALAVGCLAAGCLLTGCSGTDDPPSPTRPPGPAGPPLSGRLLVQTKDDNVWALHASGGAITATLTATATGAAALSPDGKTLAYVASTGLVLKDLATGAVRSLRSGTSDTVTTGFGDCLAWSPDGRRLLFLAAGGLYATTLDGVLTVIDLPRRAAYVPMATGGPGFPYLLPSPDQSGPSTDV
jgi:hypothetical protein